MHQMFEFKRDTVPTQIVHGRNRRYLVAPLGNLIDERYTVSALVELVETCCRASFMQLPAN
jgi:hypothetical protein